LGKRNVQNKIHQRKRILCLLKKSCLERHQEFLARFPVELFESKLQSSQPENILQWILSETDPFSTLTLEQLRDLITDSQTDNHRLHARVDDLFEAFQIDSTFVISDNLDQAPNQFDRDLRFTLHLLFGKKKIKKRSLPGRPTLSVHTES
jgi:hypothetical protein